MPYEPPPAVAVPMRIWEPRLYVPPVNMIVPFDPVVTLEPAMPPLFAPKVPPVKDPAENTATLFWVLKLI